jgi:hypothetical protein
MDLAESIFAQEAIPLPNAVTVPEPCILICIIMLIMSNISEGNNVEMENVATSGRRGTLKLQRVYFRRV